jgi:hypothetical protein
MRVHQGVAHRSADNPASVSRPNRDCDVYLFAIFEQY